MMPGIDNSTGTGNLILLPGLEPETPEVDAWSVEPDPTIPSTSGLEEDDALSPPKAHELPGAIEAILLAADGPVSENQLNAWLALPG